MFGEFIQFLRKTNALALAWPSSSGGIGKVVTSVVNDCSCRWSAWLGGGDWRAWQIVLKAAPDGKVLSAIGVGSFLGALVDFVIIALFVFVIARAFLREPPPAPGPAMKTCAACGESVLAKATRCKFCTSAV